MKEIGQLLKEKRQALNISLEEVSIATKINVKILQALEDGDLDRLPAKTFVRGFVQTYSKYLGLNTNEILAKLQEIVGTTKPQIAITQAPTESANTGPIDTEVDFLSKSKSVITLVGIVITIVAIVVIQNIISKREADLDTTEVAAITGSDTPVTITQASPSPTPTPELQDSSPAPTSAPVIAASPAAKQTPAPQAAVIPAEKSIPAPTPTEEPKQVAVSVPTPAGPSSPQEVIVEALDNIILTISIDGKPTQDVSMMADQIQTFKANSKIRITTSNSGALSIIHNGKELGVPGNLGQPKTISFPQ